MGLVRDTSEVKSTLSMVRMGAEGKAISFSVATTLPLERARLTTALVVVPVPAVLLVLTPVTGRAVLLTLTAVPSLVTAETYLPLSALPPVTDWSAPPIASLTALLIFSFVEAAVASWSVSVDQSSETAGDTTPSICFTLSFCMILCFLIVL